MRPIFIISLVASLLSLAGALALSAMTVIPGTEADRFLGVFMIVIAVFLPYWVSSAYRTRPQKSVQPSEHLPKWLTRAWEASGVLYSLAILVFVLG
jgi:predicted membrane channel-forming protein YqfA (hemolysin III family)